MFILPLPDMSASNCAQNGVYTVGGSIETPIKASAVYNMLVDYPNLNKVFSSIDECQTLTEKQALQLLQVSALLSNCPSATIHMYAFVAMRKPAHG